MSKWWYLCGRSGIIKYAGEFESFDDAEEGIREVNLDWIWIFDGKPEIEKELPSLEPRTLEEVASDLCRAGFDCDQSDEVRGLVNEMRAILFKMEGH